MKISVIITAYNYRNYITEAVDSVLRQTFLPYEVVIVDDGSTDDTVALLEECYGTNPLVHIISTPNRGQLAAFAHGARTVTGDAVSFLDADDIWESGYLKSVVDCYSSRPSVDMVISNLRYFGARTVGHWNESMLDIDHGITSCLVSLTLEGHWIGAPTSCLTLRTPLLNRILELSTDFHAEWKIEADNCLVVGCSILGGHKYSIGKPLVAYRVHEKNNWYQRKRDIYLNFQSKRKNDRMKNFYCIASYGSRLPNALLVHLEFKTIENPNFARLRRYVLMTLKAEGSFITKIRVVLILIKFWAGFTPR